MAKYVEITAPLGADFPIAFTPGDDCGNPVTTGVTAVDFYLAADGAETLHLDLSNSIAPVPGTPTYGIVIPAAALSTAGACFTYEIWATIDGESSYQNYGPILTLATIRSSS